MDFPSCNLKRVFTVWPSDELRIVVGASALNSKLSARRVRKEVWDIGKLLRGIPILTIKALPDLLGAINWFTPSGHQSDQF